MRHQRPRRTKREYARIDRIFRREYRLRLKDYHQKGRRSEKDLRAYHRADAKYKKARIAMQAASAERKTASHASDLTFNAWWKTKHPLGMVVLAYEEFKKHLKEAGLEPMGLTTAKKSHPCSQQLSPTSAIAAVTPNSEPDIQMNILK